MESKHHTLARSLRSGPTDRDLKPNAVTRDQLNVSMFIISTGHPMDTMDFALLCLGRRRRCHRRSV